MEKSVDQIKQTVQRWIVLGGVCLLGGKFAAFFLTNSVGILTDAMESIVNVVAGLISLYSLRMAAQPKDKLHPFGHGKVELISASVEGVLIMLAGGVIVFEGVRRFFTPEMPQSLDIGIVIIALSGIVNFAMGWYSIRVGKRWNSMALIAGGKHLQSDTYSTIGLVAGLILLYITKLPWIDSALAVVFGGIIIYTGIGILRKTIANLMDKADMKLIDKMLVTINEHRRDDWIDIHNLKVITYGSYFYIDCDLTLPWYYNIRQGHSCCDALKETILSHFSDQVLVSVHSDACQPSHCSGCGVDGCVHRTQDLVRVEALTFEELVENDNQRDLRLGIN